ncbi:hypothetical protein [Bradyrhizobium sp. cf659]|uniref:hypothetical protein n=1 Tax=Bradyrhizobium sp. cf659 TaxID=1761771 RepID=UPI0011603C02|nr:hypothetical protein [Bradyrhizobium sp. cf659]
MFWTWASETAALDLEPPERGTGGAGALIRAVLMAGPLIRVPATGRPSQPVSAARVLARARFQLFLLVVLLVVGSGLAARTGCTITSVIISRGRRPDALERAGLADLFRGPAAISRPAHAHDLESGAARQSAISYIGILRTRF